MQCITYCIHSKVTNIPKYIQILVEWGVYNVMFSTHVRSRYVCIVYIYGYQDGVRLHIPIHNFLKSLVNFLFTSNR